MSSLTRPRRAGRPPASENGETREQIITILRRYATGTGPTEDELVEKTGLSKTAVRSHIKTLRESGMVRNTARRREIVLITEAQS